MSLSLNWISTDGGGKAAPGRHYTYRIVVSPDLRVRLARVSRDIAGDPGAVAELIEQVMLTTIDLGSQPPREGVYRAMALAQQFEDGEPLIGQPEWQEPPAPGPAVADAATTAGRALHEFPADRETPGRILDAAAEQEHLAMTGLELRVHLAAPSTAQPVRGHNVPNLARQAGVANGYDGLQALHRRRHELSEGRRD